MKGYLLCILSVCLLFGCNNNNGETDDLGGHSFVTTRYTKSYIMAYAAPMDGIGLSESTRGTIELNAQYKGLVMYTEYVQTEKTKAAYEALCKKHADTSFNSYVSVKQNDALSLFDYIMDKNSIVASDDFTKIDIVSDSDFDETHKAGSSLNDIVEFEYQSPAKYIRSGYRDTSFAADNKPTTGFALRKPVSELAHDDLTMFNFIIDSYHDLKYSIFDFGNDFTATTSLKIGTLSFTVTPTLSKTHNVTVSMTTDDGRVLTAAAKVAL